MTGYSLVNILGGLLIVTSMLVVLAKTPRRGAYLYAVQSLVIVALFVALGVTTGSTELYKWSVTALITKVIVAPGIILFALKKLGDGGVGLESKLSPVKIIVVIAIEVFLCFVVVQGITLPTAAEVKPALAISLAHFFVGLTCIVTQRNIVKQIFGYCLMENGSSVTLALLAPQAPELVEIGVSTDAFFAVLIMAVMVVRIYKHAHTLDADDLMELKG